MKSDREQWWTAFFVGVFILATIALVLWVPEVLHDSAAFIETGQVPPDDSDVRVLR